MSMNLTELNEEFEKANSKVTEIKGELLKIALPILQCFKDYVEQNPDLYFKGLEVSMPTEYPNDFTSIILNGNRSGYIIDYYTWVLGGFDEISYFIPVKILTSPAEYRIERLEFLKEWD